MDNQLETPVSAQADIKAVEQAAERLIKRLPNPDSIKWRLENPQFGKVFSIRSQEWKFSDKGRYTLTVEDQNDKVHTLTMRENAYRDFLAQPPLTAETPEEPYFSLLVGVALKLGAYQSFLQAAEKQLKGRDTEITQELGQALRQIQQHTEARITQDAAVVGAEQIPLTVEGFRGLVGMAQQEYDAGFKIQFGAVTQR